MTDDTMETPLKGWKQIGKFLGKTERTIKRKKEKLLRYGAIWETMEGRPPHKIWCAYPTTLRQFMVLLTSKREKF